MKITAKLLDHSTATKFGHASGSCVSPPEEDYRTETWEVRMTFKYPDDSWDDISDILQGRLDDVARPAIDRETDLEAWEYNDDKERDLRFDPPVLLSEYGTFVFVLGIIATQPFRRTGGSYERIG